MKKIFLIFAVLILSCTKQKNIENKIVDKKIIDSTKNDNALEEFKKSKYFSYDKITECKYKVLKDGDKFAYSDLVLYYSYNKSKKIEILPYSLIMVEKHHKYDYCSNVFENLLEFYSEVQFESYYDGKNESLIPYLKNIELLNTKQKEYAFYFLNLGAKNNAIGSVAYLEIIKRYGLGMTINFKQADSLREVKLHLKKERN